jgi:long-subunit acyl-CoA synthetase (AMP-forming)
MAHEPFPPKHEGRQGFYEESVYRTALGRYRTINDLIEKKAKENEEKVWLEFQDGRTFTYRDIYTQSLKLAAGLKENGVQAGDHVALFAHNSPEWICPILQSFFLELCR